ncbi:uncharacterized protein PHACADRAFT_254323 [Phanerochaete carnosa HHB-10118-sp]|uniref:Uncharacterized protein n=1 Tax=Phanerochaete carnosa (strain HHB-10118-sp) TaxID=650164 RepID=K5X2C2_PHACS|nr:uncharacterized protein PHACADRAFT_254323 [Phanerochaete carnosa HHB-10118-sp]EKM56927.1 hypothetical protein PHACADRAFT_254323 [Phanerochaete carnosa HHB-10118-sp]
MTSENGQLAFSQQPVSGAENQNEDWDRSIRGTEGTRGVQGETRKRTLSDLLRLHTEKGKDLDLSPEEANQLAEVLGRWINSESSPFEGEDTFFTPSQSQDDSVLPSRRSTADSFETRPRGQSESMTGLSS